MNHKKRLSEIVDYSIKYDTFNKARIIENASNICVFGLGTFFEEAFESKKVREKYRVNMLSDNDPSKWGSEMYGLPVVKPEMLKEIDDLVVIIMLGNPLPVQEQMDQLGIRWVTYVELTIDDELGFTKDKEEFINERDLIINGVDFYDELWSKELYVECIANRLAYPLSHKSYEEMYTVKEYFGIDILPMDNQEIFIDCGAYDGDTIVKFLESVDDFEHIYGFELDKSNYEKCIAKFGKDKRMTIVNKGVWNQNCKIEYSMGDGDNEPSEGISIMKADKWEAKNKGDVVRLDDMVCDKKVTYIKMDIEGAELNALMGAEETIRRCKPKLAICVYHKTSDFWKIPRYIKSLNDDYVIFLRHHSTVNCWGTVLYAKQR